jgi:DMSO/TMAO reductase YedYZ molybdopterin-dependent catalytic subunit
MEKTTRRTFLKKGFGLLPGTWLLLSPIFSGAKWVWGQAQRIILPKGTKRESLIDKNPEELDTRNLEVTPLQDFETMGQTDYKNNLETWRLTVHGKVQKAIQLKFEEISTLPSIERNVLLICPGFFANHGHWKGISIMTLLKKAGASNDVTHVVIRGPAGEDEKTYRFPISDIISNKVFLAYQVNGQNLPEIHGYPLRVVAEGYYGYNWVKYVYRLTAEKEDK